MYKYERMEVCTNIQVQTDSHTHTRTREEGQSRCMYDRVGVCLQVCACVREDRERKKKKEGSITHTHKRSFDRRVHTKSRLCARLADVSRTNQQYCTGQYIATCACLLAQIGPHKTTRRADWQKTYTCHKQDERASRHTQLNAHMRPTGTGTGTRTRRKTDTHARLAKRKRQKHSHVRAMHASAHILHYLHDGMRTRQLKKNTHTTHPPPPTPPFVRVHVCMYGPASKHLTHPHTHTMYVCVCICVCVCVLHMTLCVCVLHTLCV
eukprot:GDKI01006129.1.p1 GENE.GDKI01006129.1~~GDKI01006129.1.p1  ORF type:complete len:265 (-),score=53.47 GDKI01006129.1:487-1281(-)